MRSLGPPLPCVGGDLKCRTGRRGWPPWGTNLLRGGAVEPPARRSETAWGGNGRRGRVCTDFLFFTGVFYFVLF